MSKVKQHKGARKRFKVSGSGKILHKATGRRHNFRTKSKDRKRNLRKDRVLRVGEAARMRQLFPYEF